MTQLTRSPWVVDVDCSSISLIVVLERKLDHNWSSCVVAYIFFSLSQRDALFILRERLNFCYGYSEADALNFVSAQRIHLSTFVFNKQIENVEHFIKMYMTFFLESLALIKKLSLQLKIGVEGCESNISVELNASTARSHLTKGKIAIKLLMMKWNANFLLDWFCTVILPVTAKRSLLESTTCSSRTLLTSCRLAYIVRRRQQTNYYSANALAALLDP